MISVLNKSLSLALSFLLCTQVALGSIAESTVWKERQQKRGAPETGRPMLAALPTAISPSHIPPTQALLGQWPSVSRDVSPHARPLKKGSLQTLVAAVPFQNASVKEVVESKRGNGPAVVLIQDVHLNPEAQGNIAAVLQNLLETKQVGVVGVEGAFEAFDFAPFRSYQEKQIVRDVTDLFLQKNLLSAPSFVGINSPQAPPLFVGVDSREHHAANVKAYRDSEARLPRVKRQWAEAGRRLKADKERFFNASLKEFDALQDAYRKGEMGLGAYLKRLVAFQEPASLMIDQFLEAFDMESRLDFAQVERERRRVIERLARVLSPAEFNELLTRSLSYRLGKIPYTDFYRAFKDLCQRKGVSLRQAPQFDEYIRYVLLSDGIKSDTLLNDVARWEKGILDELAKTPKEKRLTEASTYLHLVGKLIKFELTPEEWAEYKNVRHPGASRDPGRQLNLDSGFRRKDDRLASFESFYEEADLRSQLMLSSIFNLQSVICNLQLCRILVTGGFHTPEIAQRLREKDIGYLIVAPKITRVDSTSGSAYLSVFSREKTPLEKLFVGEELFLSPTHTHLTEPRLRVALMGAIDNVIARVRGFSGVAGSRRSDQRSALRWWLESWGNLIHRVHEKIIQIRDIFFSVFGWHLSAVPILSLNSRSQTTSPRGAMANFQFFSRPRRAEAKGANEGIQPPRLVEWAKGLNRIGVSTAKFDDYRKYRPHGVDIKNFVDTMMEPFVDPKGLFMVDTSPSHAGGEKMLGDFLRAHPQVLSSAIVATKCGENQNRMVNVDFSPGDLRRSLQRSAGLLGRVDVLYLENPSLRVVRGDKILEELSNLKAEGVGGLKWIGISISEENLLKAVTSGDALMSRLDAIQLSGPLYIAHRDMVQKMRDRGLFITVQQPVVETMTHYHPDPKLTPQFADVLGADEADVILVAEADELEASFKAIQLQERDRQMYDFLKGKIKPSLKQKAVFKKGLRRLSTWLARSVVGEGYYLDPAPPLSQFNSHPVSLTMTTEAYRGDFHGGPGILKNTFFENGKGEECRMLQLWSVSPVDEFKSRKGFFHVSKKREPALYELLDTLAETMAPPTSEGRPSLIDISQTLGPLARLWGVSDRPYQRALSAVHRFPLEAKLMAALQTPVTIHDVLYSQITEPADDTKDPAGQINRAFLWGRWDIPYVQWWVQQQARRAIVPKQFGQMEDTRLLISDSVPVEFNTQTGFAPISEEAFSSQVLRWTRTFMKVWRMAPTSPLAWMAWRAIAMGPRGKDVKKHNVVHEKKSYPYFFDDEGIDPANRDRTVQLTLAKAVLSRLKKLLGGVGIEQVMIELNMDARLATGLGRCVIFNAQLEPSGRFQFYSHPHQVDRLEGNKWGTYVHHHESGPVTRAGLTETQSAEMADLLEFTPHQPMFVGALLEGAATEESGVLHLALSKAPLTPAFAKQFGVVNPDDLDRVLVEQYVKVVRFLAQRHGVNQKKKILVGGVPDPKPLFEKFGVKFPTRGIIPIEEFLRLTKDVAPDDGPQGRIQKTPPTNQGGGGVFLPGMNAFLKKVLIVALAVVVVPYVGTLLFPSLGAHHGIGWIWATAIFVALPWFMPASLVRLFEKRELAGGEETDDLVADQVYVQIGPDEANVRFVLKVREREEGGTPDITVEGPGDVDYRIEPPKGRGWFGWGHSAPTPPQDERVVSMNRQPLFSFRAVRTRQGQIKIQLKRLDPSQRFMSRSLRPQVPIEEALDLYGINPLEMYDDPAFFGSGTMVGSKVEDKPQRTDSFFRRVIMRNRLPSEESSLSGNLFNHQRTYRYEEYEVGNHNLKDARPTGFRAVESLEEVRWIAAGSCRYRVALGPSGGGQFFIQRFRSSDLEPVEAPQRFPVGQEVFIGRVEASPGQMSYRQEWTDPLLSSSHMTLKVLPPEAAAGLPARLEVVDKSSLNGTFIQKLVPRKLRKDESIEVLGPMREVLNERLTGEVWIEDGGHLYQLTVSYVEGRFFIREFAVQRAGKRAQVNVVNQWSKKIGQVLEIPKTAVGKKEEASDQKIRVSVSKDMALGCLNYEISADKGSPVVVVDKVADVGLAWPADLRIPSPKPGSDVMPNGEGGIEKKFVLIFNPDRLLWERYDARDYSEMNNDPEVGRQLMEKRQGYPVWKVVDLGDRVRNDVIKQALLEGKREMTVDLPHRLFAGRDELKRELSPLQLQKFRDYLKAVLVETGDEKPAIWLVPKEPPLFRAALAREEMPGPESEGALPDHVREMTSAEQWSFIGEVTNKGEGTVYKQVPSLDIHERVLFGSIRGAEVSGLVDLGVLRPLMMKGGPILVLQKFVPVEFLDALARENSGRVPVVLVLSNQPITVDLTEALRAVSEKRLSLDVGSDGVKINYRPPTAPEDPILAQIRAEAREYGGHIRIFESLTSDTLTLVTEADAVKRRAELEVIEVQGELRLVLKEPSGGSSGSVQLYSDLSIPTVLVGVVLTNTGFPVCGGVAVILGMFGLLKYFPPSLLRRPPRMPSKQNPPGSPERKLAQALVTTQSGLRGGNPSRVARGLDRVLGSPVRGLESVDRPDFTGPENAPIDVIKLEEALAALQNGRPQDAALGTKPLAITVLDAGLLRQPGASEKKLEDVASEIAAGLKEAGGAGLFIMGSEDLKERVQRRVGRDHFVWGPAVYNQLVDSQDHSFSLGNLEELIVGHEPFNVFDSYQLFLPPHLRPDTTGLSADSILHRKLILILFTLLNQAVVIQSIDWSDRIERARKILINA
ncbi:MAG: aldo/keto reductase [Elusimicrobia bacterium]|nr:aldo/keto reductase [Candidatus Obscuribacterium magneticum]MCB4755887.1 aldo/keto reductase [Candidatus Obscuribacterium magneticum]